MCTLRSSAPLLLLLLLLLWLLTPLQGLQGRAPLGAPPPHGLRSGLAEPGGRGLLGGGMERGREEERRRREFFIDTRGRREVKRSKRMRDVNARDMRQKEKFLKHLTGPLSFNPKCKRQFYKLYYNTRDCTNAAFYRRCAVLLTRLAGSPRCTEG